MLSLATVIGPLPHFVTPGAFEITVPHLLHGLMVFVMLLVIMIKHDGGSSVGEMWSVANDDSGGPGQFVAI